MAKRTETRVRPKETTDLGGIKVTNRTGNSIMVRKSRGAVEVVACCLEEQGM